MKLIDFINTLPKDNIFDTTWEFIKIQNNGIFVFQTYTRNVKYNNKYSGRSRVTLKILNQHIYPLQIRTYGAALTQETIDSYNRILLDKIADTIPYNISL